MLDSHPTHPYYYLKQGCLEDICKSIKYDNFFFIFLVSISAKVMIGIFFLTLNEIMISCKSVSMDSLFINKNEFLF